MKDRAKWMDHNLPGTCLAPLQMQPVWQDPLEITIAPNPMNTHTIISFYGNKLQGEKELLVYDLTGRLVHRQKTLSNSSFVFERKTLPAGVYILKIMAENHPFATEKLSIE